MRPKKTRANPAIVPEHQNSLKHVFTHKEAMRALLTGFSPPDVVREMDLYSLELVNISFVTGDLRKREDDIV